MDISFVMEFISPIALCACLCVGFIIKHAFNNKSVNRFIPLIVAGLGLLICVWAEDWVISPQILVAGLISGLASTGLYEAFKQVLGVKEEE